MCVGGGGGGGSGHKLPLASIYHSIIIYTYYVYAVNKLEIYPVPLTNIMFQAVNCHGKGGHVIEA